MNQRFYTNKESVTIKENKFKRSPEMVKLWNDYSEKYSTLSGKLIDCGIDCKLLSDVIEAREKLGFS